MRLIFLLIILMPISSLAMDRFEENANPIWMTSVNLKDNVKLQSQIIFSESKIKFISEIFDLTKDHFFQFTEIDNKSCYNGKLIINIITEGDLDSRVYFPYEYDYSDGKLFVLGRYFRHSNVLYIVPPNLNIYYWRKTFAHELMHYFYDDCGIIFRNDDLEHKQIEKFMKVKSKWFY